MRKREREGMCRKFEAKRERGHLRRPQFLTAISYANTYDFASASEEGREALSWSQYSKARFCFGKWCTFFKRKDEEEEEKEEEEEGRGALRRSSFFSQSLSALLSRWP